MNPQGSDGGQVKVCPRDKSVHPTTAVTCNLCGHIFGPGDVQAVAASAPSPPSGKWCPNCRTPAPIDAPVCSRCGHVYQTYFPYPPSPQTQAFTVPGMVQAAYPRGTQYYGGLSPDLAKKFNWGAFYFNWIWGLNHKKPITLISLALGFIPCVGFIGVIAFNIWVGFKGNEWAWESGRFATVDDLLACQKIWEKWALGVFLASFGSGCLFGGLLLLLMSMHPGS